MTESIHIIEPTLSDTAGHCRSFIESLCSAAGEDSRRFTVWGGRGAGLPGPGGSSFPVKRFFFRKFRRFQELYLLRRLLAGGDRIFISTAGRVDLVLLNWAAPSAIAPDRVFLFFHWLRPDNRKLAFFKKIAARHPNLVVMGPTPGVVDVLKGCGFQNSFLVPYPITPRDGASQTPVPFRHLLFAGAARKDKGFSHVVQLLAHLGSSGLDIPVSLQTSAAHYDKYDAETTAALERLASIAYPQLKLSPETLSNEAYCEIFRGAICLQPYDPVAFADRISGITLDGLSMGAPLITLAGTWMARVVERFGAGIVVREPTPELLLGAAQTIRADYPRFRSQALLAGAALQREHQAGHLLNLLSQERSSHGS